MGTLRRKIDTTPIWDYRPLQVNPKKPLKVKKSNSGFLEYKEKVDKYTSEVKHLIEGIETRGWHTYHIDHKISIKYGYSNGLPPEHIGDISNLRMLWWEENKNKNVNCFIDDNNKWILGDTCSSVLHIF